MSRVAMTPFDIPKTLWDRLTFPSLKYAYEQGAEIGYLEGKGDGIDAGFLSMKPLLDDPKWLRDRADKLEEND